MSALAQGLLLWGLLSLGAALFGLWWAQSPFWRGFFFMNGAWGLVDGALGLYALGQEAPGNLREILLLNAGLDVLYLLAGALLFLRGRKAPHRGFGLAILVQGGFLLAFDLGHALRLAG
ncbi:DUF6992 family protein [Thermus thermamylovorans]|uniref:Uncharacterized protein n=1 Tax=Thermus thermamylovorans TaxID=2509362 RepID=A0A4Q9B694_9DEIN|nr:hypothetical protein [Thermus thermamylovorans]TBH21569.1 hypothetical protein ETP66_02875 [Thermus thermamylovorans]